MAEYIERDAAIKAIKNADCNAIADGAESYDLSYLKEIFFNIPAADVVPVVRCKDCKHAYINGFSAASGVALCSSNAKVMQQDDFCSYGERKDGGAG